MISAIILKEKTQGFPVLLDGILLVFPYDFLCLCDMGIDILSFSRVFMTWCVLRAFPRCAATTILLPVSSFIVKPWFHVKKSFAQNVAEALPVTKSEREIESVSR